MSVCLQGVQVQSPVLTCILLTREAELACTVLPALSSIAQPSKSAGHSSDRILPSQSVQPIAGLTGEQQVTEGSRGISIRYLPGSGLLVRSILSSCRLLVCSSLCISTWESKTCCPALHALMQRMLVTASASVACQAGWLLPFQTRCSWPCLS